jgi:hypothetical protein
MVRETNGFSLNGGCVGFAALDGILLPTLLGGAFFKASELGKILPDGTST